MGSSSSCFQFTNKAPASQSPTSPNLAPLSPYSTLPPLGDTCSSTRDGPVKLFRQDENPKDKLVGVVVTIFQDSSYDEMFREKRPTTVPGERVSTYSIGCCDVATLLTYLAATVSSQYPDLWNNLIEDIRAVPADSVVFNWECCSACGDHAFPCTEHADSMHDHAAARPGSSATMRFIGFALRSGFTVMCSDFSLKSLIFEWSEEQLGPNPFLKVGACDHQFSLEFVPQDLANEEVPQQLQVVGELCKDSGKAVVSAMSDTIVYTLNPNRQKTDLYDVKVLTVATHLGGFSMNGLASNMACTVGERGFLGMGGNLKRGTAGHVTLTYAEGGQLVTSMGHWIELTRINTTVESVMRCARHNFGAMEAEQIQSEYMLQRTDEQREATLQKWSHEMVSQSAPTRMKCRTKFEVEF